MNILKRSNLSVSLFLAVLLLPMLATGALVEDFESYTVGDDWLVADLPADWSFTGSDYSTLGIEADPNDAGNQVLRIVKSATTKRFVDLNNLGDPLTGSVQAAFDIYMGSTGPINLRFEETGSDTTFVLFDAESRLRVYGSTDGSGNIQDIGAYETEQWYRVIHDFTIPEADPGNSYFDVSIYKLSSGEGALGDLVASTSTSIPFVASTGLDRFRFYTYDSAGGQDVRLDNITIIPEPGVAGLILVGLGGLAIRKRRRHG